MLFSYQPHSRFCHLFTDIVQYIHLRMTIEQTKGYSVILWQGPPCRLYTHSSSPFSPKIVNTTQKPLVTKKKKHIETSYCQPNPKQVVGKNDWLRIKRLNHIAPTVALREMKMLFPAWGRVEKKFKSITTCCDGGRNSSERQKEFGMTDWNHSPKAIVSGMENCDKVDW